MVKSEHRIHPRELALEQCMFDRRFDAKYINGMFIIIIMIMVMKSSPSHKILRIQDGKETKFFVGVA